MRHLLRSLLLAAVAAAFLPLGGCAAKPRERPVRMGPVDTGPGSLAAARQYLEGQWTLLSFEVHPPGREVIPVKGDGTLLFDDFANLKMEVRTDEATGQALAKAGIPMQNGVLSMQGRAAVDMTNQTLTFVREGQPLIVPPTGPLAGNRPRYWTVDADVLTLSTKGDDGAVLSVARWRKQSK